MNDNFHKFIEFTSKYPEFVYEGYDICEEAESLNLAYHFSITGLASFNPTWKITKPLSWQLDLSDKRFLDLVFSLGMVELISYWKITCSPNVKVNCGYLSPNQKLWWKKLYKKGLGEFFYVNSINPNDDFMTINSASESYSQLQERNTHNLNTVLIPIGGGKDSAVSLEILKDCADRFCYVINPRKASADTIYAAGISADKVITAKRTLDNNMLLLNKQGFLNGHTPFSALVAFSSVIAAYIYNINFVALSNESSANEATVFNSDINHQYSKSLEFEADFINYEKQNIKSGVQYFSLLRPLTEIGIAKIFSRLNKYHLVFQSCNIGSKNDNWCGCCPKCLFVYIILAPFLQPSKMVEIFGKNLLDDEQLIPIFEELVGLKPEKPFECVGSCDEVNAAMQELIRQYELSGASFPNLVKYYKNLSVDKCYNIKEMCLSLDAHNYVPDLFLNELRKNLNWS